MNLDDLKHEWRAQPGFPESNRLELMRLAASMERRRRAQTLVLGCFCLNTIAAAMLTGWMLLHRGLDGGRIWAVLLLQLVLAWALGLLVRRHRRRGRDRLSMAAPVREALQRALRETVDEIQGMKFLAKVGSVALVLICIAVLNLHAEGKMDARAIAGFAGMAITIFLANAARMIVRYRQTLGPRRERVQALLAELEFTGS